MKNHTIIVRRETPADYKASENLTREAFWNVYCPGCMEHYVLHCDRDDPAFVPELDLVMELDGALIGHIMYVHSEIRQDNGITLPIMTFGPVSIDPGFQRQGYGKRLVEESLEIAKQLGTGAVAITGNIKFYERAGFVLGKSMGIRYAEDPDAGYFLIRELIPGYLDGVTGAFRDPEGYFVCEKDPDGFARFEATFPKKEKLKLPGQLS